MPNKYPTLLDVAKLDAGAAYAVIDETVERYPELMLLPATSMLGTALELTVLKSLPVVGFRNAGEGSPSKRAEFETKIFQTAIIEEFVQVDKRGVLAASKEKARFLINQSLPIMKAVMTHLAKQMYYGTGNDPKGFPGLLAQYSADDLHEVDVTGAAAKSSVWFIEAGPEMLEFMFGDGGTLVMAEDWEEVTAYDAQSQPYKALQNVIGGRPGFRLSNKHAAIRIKNIGIAANKTLTDAHMYSALRKCEDLGIMPNLIFGNGRSFEQLRQSRTSFSPTGAPPPRLRDWESIPLAYTTNISVTEA